jgi:16S rRNA processing protein RimM
MTASDQPEPASSRTGEAQASPVRVPRKTGNQRRKTAPRRLGETRGPDPHTPLQDVKLAAGTIGGAHGIHGEMKLHLLTDHPEHLATIRQVFLGNSDEPVNLLGVRFHADGALIRLEGIDSPEAAQPLGGLTLRIRATDAKPLEPGEYFLFQLIGLVAHDETGAEIGTVSDLMETGAHDVLVIRPVQGGEDILVPNHPEYVISIDPEHQRIDLRLPVYE